MLLHRRQFLQMAGVAAMPSRRSCILVWQRGGASHLDTFDPKDGSIATRLPLIARQMRHLTIVRSITSKETNHERATAALRFGAPPAECGLASESPSLRDRYGRTRLGEACLLARRAVQSGARFVTVDGGLDWDTHRAHERAMQTLLPQFDYAFAALVEDLEERRMLGSTLVVAMGEFGRSPKLNRYGGRDHHSRAWSVCLAGWGLPGGRIIGATDSTGTEVIERPIEAAELVAAIRDGRSIGGLLS